MVRLAALSTVVAAVALVAGIWYVSSPNDNGDEYASCRSTQIAGGTDQIGGPFTMVNAKGETVTDKDVITEPSLVYFG